MRSNRVGISGSGLGLLVAALALAGCLGGCTGGGAVPPKSGTGGGGASGKDGGGGDTAVVPLDAASDKSPVCPLNAPKGSTDIGLACSCDSDCGSGFCGNGVCCSTACKDKCMACDLPGSEGTCAAVPAGVKPSNPNDCGKDAESTCSQDGTCDGQGACRKHQLGTVCSAGACAGDGMTNVNICDGKGACRQGPDESCTPYTCTGNQCLTKCTSDRDCSAGHNCLNNKCGKLPTGRGPCETGDDCTSGHCADKVCCNTTCKGECVSCNQIGFVGQCLPLGTGLTHPACTVQPKATCGMTGVCDAFGCAFYAAETVCVPPACSGNMLNTAGTCDGMGTCQPPGQVECDPFTCLTDKCRDVCRADSDCVAPKVCVNGSCGKKPNGSPCTSAAQCTSEQCADGVCCDVACTGACQSCALQSSLGQCKSVAKGAADPHAKCKDTGAASCGTNSKCDGAGACQKYAVDTPCAGESCVGGAYTPQSTCNASGQCIPPASQTCFPFACNGTTKCFETCTANTQCVGTNTCVNGSCGLKPLGAKCSAATECLAAPDGKQYCSQGVCCNNACNTACQACNLAASLGTCSAVANNAADPQGICKAAAQSTCGQNGKCRSGACDVFHTNDVCKAATCSNASTSLAATFCDGRGSACPAQTASTSCGVYTCDSTNGLCRSSCTTDAQCTSPNTCINGSCGKKSNGASCSAANQCLSGNCTEGVCCNTACTDGTNGTCQSCKVSGKVGTCSPVVAGGSDPKSRCAATTSTTCGLNGSCDGTGKCAYWDTGTGCRNQTCAGSTQTNAAKCDGKGACPAVSTNACDPYMCGTNACKTTCTASADCNSGVTCNTQTNKCGDKLPNGRVCTVGSDCSSANCVKAAASDTTGICCNTACTGGCESCTAATSGTCTAIAAGGTPRIASMCPVTTTCANTGKCDGARACQIATAGTTCTDSNACTLNDICQNGACVGTVKTCTASDTCHVAGTCDAATGNCSNPAAASGTGCNDNNACTTVDTCQGGACSGGSPKTCTASDQCHSAGTCDKGTGVCSNPVRTGTCDDGNACTTGETCSSAGVCAGGTGTVCPDPDQCHNAGVCNTVSGLCSNPAKGNGATCSDGNSCTTGDSCQSGSCTGSAVTCTASDQCHTAGVCNTSTGTCSNPEKADGVTCSDGNACTNSDSCQSGSCTGSAVTCTASDQCHAAGVCNTSTGTCSNPAKADGETCNDGNACTKTDSCQSGACTGANPVSCMASDQCHSAGTCNRTTGECSNPPQSGTCNDGNECTTGDSCSAGECVGTAVVCQPSDACHVAGTCNANGVCSNPVGNNGDPCTDATGSSGTCQGGSCNVGDMSVVP